MITVILMGAEKSGNLGAVCRVMKNFGFNDLVLIEPKYNWKSQTAKNWAKHAQDVLKKVKVKKIGYLNKFDYLIGTTSKLGTDYNIPRSPITPEQLVNQIKGKKNKIGIVFGPEGEGLTNEQIGLCDFVVTIPVSRKYPVLNLSHSVGIVLYELYKAVGVDKVGEHILFVSKTEKDQLMKMLGKVLNKMEFATPEKKETQRKVWKRMISKSFMTKREAYALMGFLRKIK